jgi:glutathione S-transferase
VCAVKVRLTFAEKGISWESRYVEILKGEQFEPDYLKINPNGVVPTLVHDGYVIIESTIIAEYINDLFDSPPLVPIDARQHAAMLMWTKHVDEKLHSMTSALTYICSHRHTILEDNSPEQVEEIINETRDPVKRTRKRQWIELGLDAPGAADAVKMFRSTLRLMEASLEGSLWLAGDTYSLADIALTPYANRLLMLGMKGFWNDLPKVTEWFKRVSARPNFEPAVLSWVPAGLASSLSRNGAKSWPRVKDMLDAL